MGSTNTHEGWEQFCLNVQSSGWVCVHKQTGGAVKFVCHVCTWASRKMNHQLTRTIFQHINWNKSIVLQHIYSNTTCSCIETTWQKEMYSVPDYFSLLSYLYSTLITPLVFLLLVLKDLQTYTGYWETTVTLRVLQVEEKGQQRSCSHSCEKTSMTSTCKQNPYTHEGIGKDMRKKSPQPHCCYRLPSTPPPPTTPSLSLALSLSLSGACEKKLEKTLISVSEEEW